MPADDPQKSLRAAWDDMIEMLQSARDGIDQPELMPPPSTPRNLAEGYRYLMGFVHFAVERAFHEDPTRPHFRNALSIINRSTIDNADAIYFYAPIDGTKETVIRGRAADHRVWSGEPPAEIGPKAPHYLIFEASQGDLAGDSGSLQELAPGMKAQTGRLDCSDLVVEPGGHFEILLAPEKPAGYDGNFISTLKVVNRPHPTDPSRPPERYASYVSGRQLFYDWEREQSIHFEIEQRGAEGTSPTVYGPEAAAAQLRHFGELVRNQMHFWNAFWTIPMGTYGPREGGIPGIEFPRNGFNQMNSASGATGGGMSTNLYCGGVFELDDDEALVIENTVKPHPDSKDPNYVGFQLGNLWGESIEYGSATGSLNGFQADTDPDGVMRLVVAHRDPGIANWLDTTGHREGFLTPRWAYSQQPPPETWPTITAKKVRFDEIHGHLPDSTRSVTPDERRAQIRRRQLHVQRRFRVF